VIASRCYGCNALASEPIIDQNIAALGALTCMNEAEKSAINQNGRRLFRRFAAERAE